MSAIALAAARTWKEFLHRSTSWQSRILLGMTYYIVLGPTGLIARFVGHDLIDTSWPPRRTAWRRRTERYDTIERLKSQS